MRIVYSLDHPISDQPTVLTIGKFDGFHLGHQLLIRTAISHAQACRCQSAVLTFEPLPAQVIQPDKQTLLLTDITERTELIATLDPDILVIERFTSHLMSTTAYEYMRRITSALRVREIWVGADFALGHNREGTIPRLMEIGQELGYTVGSLAPALVKGERVSSSRVRKLLQQGDVEDVQSLLGRPFHVHGRVIEGDKRGRTIGFPTANLHIHPPHTLPARGVYVCHCYLEPGGIPLPAVVNIGVRPTFEGVEQTVEAHLLDWSGDLYDRDIRLTFLHRLRGEQRFDGIEHLVAQIHNDVERARMLLHQHA